MDSERKDREGNKQSSLRDRLDEFYRADFEIRTAVSSLVEAIHKLLETMEGIILGAATPIIVHPPTPEKNLGLEDMYWCDSCGAQLAPQDCFSDDRDKTICAPCLSKREG